MFNIEKIALTFSLNSVFFFSALLLLIAYAVFTYIYTVPEVTRLKRSLLVFLRSLALLLLLFIIFEPVLTVAQKESFRPVNLVFFDNSRSMKIEDGTGREDDAKGLFSALRKSNIAQYSELYTFGNDVRNISDSLYFSEGSTNFSEVFSNVQENKKNISSITVVSDGVLTEGSNPLNLASRLNIPVYTVGIGDSSRKNDLIVRDVIYNEYIYSGVATVISAGILNKGYSGKTVNVTLNESGKVIDRQNLTFAEDGLQELRFNYKAAEPGEKKLSISISELEGEQSTDNNRKVFFVNVLSSKIKVLIIAGAPSPDLSFIRTSLSLDENLSINSITQIAPGKFIEQNNRDALLDSAEILVLVGFPSAETDNQFLQKVFSRISNAKKPFIFFPASGTDFNRLKSLNELPFTVQRVSEGFSEVFPDINQSKIRNPLLNSGSDKTVADWNSLPPVLMINSDVTAKPESEVLATVKIRNVPINKPLILTRKMGSRKSAAVLAKDIWRWKLQTAPKDLVLFDNFLVNSVKWLNTRDDQKQVVIRTSKKLYSLGEEVDFSAQVYDASFNPIPDANVTVNIRSGEESHSLTLNALGNGLYEGTFETNKTGDYNFSGDALVDENRLGSDKGSFNIGEVDVEMINPRMDYEFLSTLASETKGEFFLPEEQDELFDMLLRRIERTSDVQVITSEFSLWSNEWLLILVVLFFAMEWFIRKQSGML
jgi:hypothetical protein